MPVNQAVILYETLHTLSATDLATIDLNAQGVLQFRNVPARAIEPNCPAVRSSSALSGSTAPFYEAQF
jgi:hypothetical protein